jgi:hypothetical protein
VASGASVELSCVNSIRLQQIIEPSPAVLAGLFYWLLLIRQRSIGPTSATQVCGAGEAPAAVARWDPQPSSVSYREQTRPPLHWPRQELNSRAVPHHRHQLRHHSAANVVWPAVPSTPTGADCAATGASIALAQRQRSNVRHKKTPALRPGFWTSLELGIQLKISRTCQRWKRSGRRRR